MKKRLVSLLLAFSMVLTFIPFSAVSAFAADDIDPTKGKLLESSTTVTEISDEYVEENGRTFQMKGDYYAPFDITAEGEVTINITGKVNYLGAKSSFASENYAIRAKNPNGNVTINNKSNYTVTTKGVNEMRGFLRVYNVGGNAVVNGGIYDAGGTTEEHDKETFFNHKGTMYLNDVNVDGTECVNNWGTTIIHGGVFKGGAMDNTKGTYTPTMLNKVGGNLTLVNAEVYAADGACIGNLNNANGSVVTIEESKLTCDGTFTAISNGDKLYFKSGTISAPNGSAILSRENAVLTEITGGTIKNSKEGIRIRSGEVILKKATFENNTTDIYLNAEKQITIDKNFGGTLTVGCADMKEGRQITTATNDDAQKKFKLVCVSDDYIIGYKKNDDGTVCRYLTQRTGYLVDIEDGVATAEIDGETVELDNLTQVPKKTEVTVTANKAPEGMVFDQWRVTDKSGTLIGHYKEETFTFEMPENDVTLEAMYRSDTIDDDVEQALGIASAAAVGVAGAAVLGYTGYQIGTELYLIYLLPSGATIPANRGELAKLMWQDAGKPEPAVQAVYSDIAADDTETQQAAQWAMENELMTLPDADQPDSFAPDASVSRMDVIKTWNKYQQLKNN